MKIKLGDKVKILNGKDKGKTGSVKKVFPAKEMVIVEGVNFVTKFEKRSSDQKKGGLIKIEGPLNVSKLQLIDPKENKPSRVGYKTVDGKKVRIAKATKNQL